MSEKDLFAPPSPDEIKAARSAPDPNIFAPPTEAELKAASGPSFLEKAGNEAKAFISGGSIGAEVPIVGPLGKGLGERFRAVVEPGPYGENLKRIQGENDAKDAQFAKEHPVADIGQKLVGGIGGAFALPVPGAGVEGSFLGPLARVAGATGLAAGDTALRTGDLEKTKQMGTSAGIIQGGLEAIPIVGRAAAPLTGPLGEAVERFGAKVSDTGAARAVKAALGNNEKAYNAIGQSRIVPAGEQALEQGIVGFGNNAKTIAGKATEAKKAAWDQVDQVFKAADEAGIKIDSRRVADDILVAAQKIEPIGKSREIANGLVKEAEDIQKLGPITLEKAQELKNRFQFKMTDPLTHALGNDGNNIINRAFGDAIKDTVQTSKLPGSENFLQNYQNSGLFGTLEKGAKKLTAKQANNRSPFSLTDYMTGGAAGVAAGVLTGDVKDAGLASVALATANNLARTRGNSALATSLFRLGNLIASKPDQIGRFAGVLEKAAQAGGTSLAATHALLLATEPDYKKAVETPPPPKGGTPMVGPDPLDRKRDAIKRRIGE